MKNLDQYYTNPKLAKDLFEYINNKYHLKNYFLLEPSAGTGSFSDLFHENSLSIDIDPKKEYIIKKDFFNLNLQENRNYFTIGNPPFGKNASLAIKFFNKASEFSEYIAFIVPKTFKKVSIQNKLNLNFHLIEEISLYKDSFIFNNKKYDVPCVFQIWKRKDEKREKVNTKIDSKYFEFTNKEEAHFAIRRVGGLAGKVILDYYDYKESSHYYIKSKIDIEDLLDALEELYPALNKKAKDSVGNPSLSKYELITILFNFYS